MKGNQKIIIIAISIIMLLLISWAVWATLTQKQPEPIEKKNGTNEPAKEADPPVSSDTPVTSGTLPTNESITAAIVKENPGLVDSKTNIPGFDIVGSKEPLPGWYVVTLYNTSVKTSNAIVVMRNIDNKLVVVAGPGTGLTNDKSLPQEVREALY